MTQGGESQIIKQTKDNSLSKMINLIDLLNNVTAPLYLQKG